MAQIVDVLAPQVVRAFCMLVSLPRLSLDLLSRRADPWNGVPARTPETNPSTPTARRTSRLRTTEDFEG